MTKSEGIPVEMVEMCPDNLCEGRHFWQWASYRKKGWVAYRSPVKAATHPHLKYCNRNPWRG